MRTSTTCGWCHEINNVDRPPVYCWNCGHRADVSRMFCNCNSCDRPAGRAEMLEQLERERIKQEGQK